MARKRMELPKMLEDWNAADEVLRRIGEIDRALEGIMGQLNEGIDKMKMECAEKARPLSDEKRELEASLQRFSDTRREDYGKIKSRTLNHGTVGYRKSTSLTLPRAAGAISGIIAALRGKGMHECIVTPSPRIDREALKKYPQDVIISVGVGVDAKEVFWYEVDKTTVE